MIHRRDVSAPLVALSFDDGPSSWTEQILDAPAAHAVLRELDRAEIEMELERTSSAIEAAVGTKPLRFRPPYFESSPDIEAVSRKLGFGEPVGADAWTEDWDQAPADQIAAEITANCRAGSIIDLHDAIPPQDRAPTPPTRDETVRAVRLLLSWLADEGLESVTVSELLTHDG
jgi:peptidoglycan/xylan/chitin deacetylase (PgdA/CDA1 family)